MGRDSDRGHHGRIFHADRSQNQSGTATGTDLNAAPVVESVAANSTHTHTQSCRCATCQRVLRSFPTCSREWCCRQRPCVLRFREVGDFADCWELLWDIERVDDDVRSADAHDSVAGSAMFTLRKRMARSSKTKNVVRLTADLRRLNIKPCIMRVRCCFGCDQKKALHQYNRRSNGATLGLTALLHIDLLEMKNVQQSARNRGQILIDHRPRNQILGCPAVETQAGGSAVQACITS